MCLYNLRIHKEYLFIIKYLYTVNSRYIRIRGIEKICMRYRVSENQLILIYQYLAWYHIQLNKYSYNPEIVEFLRYR